jgi:hypothetical protein
VATPRIYRGIGVSSPPLQTVPPEIPVVGVRATLLAVSKGVPILVKLTVRKNLGLALGMSDLDNASVHLPMPRALTEILSPVIHE